MPNERPWRTAYIAGTRHCEAIANESALRAIEACGVRVVSEWHRKPASEVLVTQEARRSTAMENYAAIDQADVLIAVPCDDHHLRGAHTEIGYALGRGIQVVLLGSSFNTMTEHERALHVVDLESLCRLLRAMS